MKYKLYEINHENGSIRYLILREDEDWPDDYIDLDVEEISTSCWLSDFLKCDDDAILIPERRTQLA